MGIGSLGIRPIPADQIADNLHSGVVTIQNQIKRLFAVAIDGDVVYL